MDQATIFCIGIIAGGILFTLLMYILSSKYLQGDFMKLPTHDGHDSDNFSDTDKDLDDLAKHHVSPFEVYTEKSASKKISTYGFESTFTAEACLKVTLEYKTRSQCLLGNILSLEKLDLKSLSTPKEIRFHVKLVPGNKHARKTQFKGVESRILALTFTMGKFTFDELKLYTSKLCIRVYGRRGPLSRSHCFGECYINLNFVSTPDEVAEFSKKILPKVKQSTSLLLSDSETDNDLDQSQSLQEYPNVDEICDIAKVAENDDGTDETCTDETV